MQDQKRKLFKMTEINKELQADFKALHEAFNCSLDAIMGPLMAGIINKEVIYILYEVYFIYFVLASLDGLW